MRNTAGVTCLAAPRPLGGYITLGAQLCTEEGRLLSDGLDRPGLPHDIAPGEEVELEVPLQAPATPGRYLLKYDLVDEWRTWFEACGSNPAERLLVVTP